MALLELIGRLGLNTQPFESGLRRARTQADANAHHIGKAFSRVGFGLLGVGSIAGAFKAIINQTEEWSKNIDAAREEFKRLGLEIDEGALASIRETGIELERLKFQLIGGTAPIVGWGATMLNRITDNMAIAMSRTVGLFNKEAGDRFYSNVENKALARQMALIGATTPEEQAKFEKERLEKKLKPRVTEPAIHHERETGLGPRDFGSLAKIGGFGVIASAAMQTHYVQQIAGATTETAKNTREIIHAVNGWRQYVDRAGFWKEIQIEP